MKIIIEANVAHSLVDIKRAIFERKRLLDQSGSSAVILRTEFKTNFLTEICKRVYQFL
jgi:hypothetical protein